jgi:hypothetical protein
MGVPSAVGVGGGSAVSVGLCVGVKVKVGGDVTVSVGWSGVISARRCGPAQETSPAPSAARNPFWRNFLRVSFLLVAIAFYDPVFGQVSGRHLHSTTPSLAIFCMNGVRGWFSRSYSASEKILREI